MDNYLPPGDWIEAAEAAAILGVSVRRVQAIAKKHATVKSIKVLDRLLFDRGTVLAYRDTPRKPGRPPANG